MIQPTNSIPDQAEIAIVATLKTKTVTGKSDLTFHLGKDDADTPYIRIWQNTGNGFFSNEWLPLASIIEILEQQGGNSFTSFVFDPLFKGKSVNTPAFLVAALLNEKVVAFDQGKKRKYVFVSAEKLLAKIDKASPRKTVKKAVKKTATKKAAGKKS
jgi:hypothetical protein